MTVGFLLYESQKEEKLYRPFLPSSGEKYKLLSFGETGSSKWTLSDYGELKLVQRPIYRKCCDVCQETTIERRRQQD
ncbi:hypothetical protein OUZ56_004781 [Daphnia magna]|uniref:Uncharacterized protein n=1 Tax=Daphnia magna TaxID=35525 RepID=A0ABQ9YQU3_9CRUS|nr:hypothetical protein OUZ56_004781 [Daphnia magna]